MTKINNSTSINWSWFNNLPQTTNSDANVVISNIKNITNIISQLEITETEKTSTVDDIENIIYTITGINPTSPNNMISQENWYNTWLSQGKPNLFSFSLNFIIEKVKTNQTSQTTSIVNDLNQVMQFILYRHFSTPIPTGYTNAGNRPRIVDNKSEYYTDMTTAIYSFFINGGQGVNGIGNNTIKEMCANFTRTNIGNSVYIKNWCGCFAPESSLTTAAKALYPESASYTAACDLLCIWPGAIKLVNPESSSDPGVNATCNAKLCIMSKFSLSNADLNGSINLNQNCPCANPDSPSGPCFCVIDSSVESLLNKTRAANGGSMADPVTFKQYCPGSQCILEQSDGSLKQVPCQNDNPGETGAITTATEDAATTLAPNIWYLFVSLLLVGLTLLQCARYIGYEPKFKVKGLLKPKAKLSKYTKSTDL